MDRAYLDSKAESLKQILEMFEEVTKTKVVFNACCCGNLAVANPEDPHWEYSDVEGYGAND